MTGQQIQLAINEILGNLKKKDFDGVPINWENLRCCEVFEKISMLHDGQSDLYAVVEEVSPDALNLQIEVQKQMLIKHHITIFVETEW